MRAKKTPDTPVKKTIEKPTEKTQPPQSQEKSNITFALDIGTRSVIGILGIHEDERFRIIDFEQRFHTERSMRDGQIENIEQVAKTIGNVKAALEKRNHVILDSVCIAAAGRTLITTKTSYEQDLDPTEEITPKLLHAIEYCALGMAQMKFENQIKENAEITSSFYCVGYSVIKYVLDGYVSSTILGHKGNKASVELIAAFLPQNVVQSLYTVTNMNHLTVANLTLEPIAAINVVVPKDIRLLNIALVDIGAGTSDIAISKNGSIVAYDMVTTAGDEITEAIMQNFLTNFSIAEKIKLALSEDGSTVDYEDILGFPHQEQKGRILKVIKPAIMALSDAISERIVEINGGQPTAIFLVGGGSQIPGLTALISQKLQLPSDHIAIAGRQSMPHIELFSEKLRNPEFITPIGIGSLSSIYNGCDFFSITVNGKRLMLLNQGDSRVMDALLLSNIKPQSLIGISPRAVTYYVNGKRFNKKGTHAIPGELFVNGKPASIDSPIRQGDDIVAKVAIDGKSPIVKINDIKDSEEFQITATLDGIPVTMHPTFYLEGEVLSGDYLIKSMDKLVYNDEPIISDLLESLHLEADMAYATFTINGKEADLDSVIKSGDKIISSLHHPQEEDEDDDEDVMEDEVTEQVEIPIPMHNDTKESFPAPPENTVQEEDIPETESALDREMAIFGAFEPEPFTTPLTPAPLQDTEVSVIGTKPLAAEQPPVEQRTSLSAPMMPAASETEEAPPVTASASVDVTTDTIQQEESDWTTAAADMPSVPDANAAQPEFTAQPTNPASSEKKNTVHISLNDVWRDIPITSATGKIFFFDMLNFVDIDPHKPQGNIVLRLNGENASYTSQIFDGDIIEIRWAE